MSATHVVSIFILLFSVIFLGMWLRAACQSILRQRFEEDYAPGVADSMQLEFLAIREALEGAPEEIADYGGVLNTLERDYEALTYLLRNAATVTVGRYSRSERLLILDFQLLRFWVRFKRLAGFESWRSGLVEMTRILEYFSNVMGQRLATFAIPIPRA
jgi:hypothetical protein